MITSLYPGTGKSDYVVHNVVNVPLEPLWVQRQRFRRQMRMLKNQGKTGEGTRNRTRGGSTGCVCCGHEVHMGQDAFMKKFQDRILPALRSFDPDLILLCVCVCVCVKCKTHTSISDWNGFTTRVCSSVRA